jgi:nucleotide-binding universal stress UspA family protein
MVCYNGSAPAIKALEIAGDRAKTFDAKIFLVMSLAGGADMPREEFQKKEAELRRIRRRLQQDGVVCETTLSVRGLERGEDLVAFARENDVDEIVIGVRKRSKVGKLVFGSTVQFVILEAHCPVLTVKSDAS